MPPQLSIENELYYPPPPGVGLIPPFPFGFVVYTQGTLGFADLVNSLEGDAGDPSDGFDAALAIVEAAADAMSVTLTVNDQMLEAASDAADVYDAITDEISTELAAATTIYDAAEEALTVAIDAQQALGDEPGPFSLPGIPGLAAIIDPGAFDIFGWIYGELDWWCNYWVDYTNAFETQVINMVLALLGQPST